MFTGIVEQIGRIEQIESIGSNRNFWISAPFISELKIDQSVAHNGVCLTVVEFKDLNYCVTAIKETLDVTNLGSWKIGDAINLERCMPANGRFDGHVVQGHVDTRGKVIDVKNETGSWGFTFQLDQPHNGLIVHKGSICINGTSLTVTMSLN
jgi:riboflavin synthase